MKKPNKYVPRPEALLEQDEPVFEGISDGPLYGQNRWDLQAVSKRESMGERFIDLESVPEGYRESVRNILTVLASPNHKAVIEAGVVQRKRAVVAGALFNVFYYIRIISRWGFDHGLNNFSDWTQDDANDFLDSMRSGQHHTGGAPLSGDAISHYIVELKRVRKFSPVLPEGGLSFQPWGTMSGKAVGQVQQQGENRTPPLPWETWAPIVAGAWTVVDRFSPDILRATVAMAKLPEKVRGPSAADSLLVVQEWARNDGVLPLHTGFGRTTGKRGEPNLRLLTRLLKINDPILNRASDSFRPEAMSLLTQMKADPNRSALGGLIQPSVVVTHDEGNCSPWISEIGLGETEHLISILRGSCYVLLAALTGMRDSEILSLTRRAISTRDGLPALLGRKYKGVIDYHGEQRGWWAPVPVMRTVEVLEELTPHADHLFSRSESNVGDYDSSRDIGRLLSFINDAPSVRVGRGEGLGLETVHLDRWTRVNANSLRRSFSVYAVTNPGAELGLGIQLGHAALRMTTGYIADGTERATKMINDERKSIMRQQAATLIRGTSPVTGKPAGVVHDMRAQVIADPRRAELLIERLADRYHLGLTNDCMFSAESAACGSEGPFLGDHICAGSDCANALYTSKHRLVLENAISRIDRFLDKGKGHIKLIEQMRRSRARLIKLAREITPDEDSFEENTQ